MNNSSSILIFAADHRKNIIWDLPYIRVTDNDESILNILNEQDLFKYRNILSEVSRYMYIYRNLNSFGKIDYIGFCHYRSFFAYLPEHNSPQLNTTDVKYLDKILTPIEQMQIIKSNNIDGILNFAYPETITFEKPDNLINWFKKLNSMLNYLNIPEPLIDFCDITIKKYIPEDLKPHFIEAQKNLNIYHANIFTVRIEIFKEMMSIFEQAFCDIKKYYEQNYQNQNDTFSKRWLGYIVEYLFINTYFHALQLSDRYKFGHCHLLKLV